MHLKSIWLVKIINTYIVYSVIEKNITTILVNDNLDLIDVII